MTLTKVNGSLGFTLRKEDDSILGHYIRALVKEPAISNGHLQPGDKIVAVSILMYYKHHFMAVFATESVRYQHVWVNFDLCSSYA